MYSPCQLISRSEITTSLTFEPRYEVLCGFSWSCHISVLMLNQGNPLSLQEKDNVFNMFYLRMHLRRIAYQHPTCSATELMLVQQNTFCPLASGMYRFARMYRFGTLSLLVSSFPRFISKKYLKCPKTVMCPQSPLMWDIVKLVNDICGIYVH